MPHVRRSSPGPLAVKEIEAKVSINGQIATTELLTDPALKAGMAVEASIEFTVPTGQGYLMPLTVLPLYGNIEPDTNAQEPGKTNVFVYDPDTETVVSRNVTVAGVRENRLIVVDGLKAGDRVASAGVSFLREGQKVKLLPDSE